MQAITIYDYILLPFYVILFYIIVARTARKYERAELRKYCVNGFFLRIAGSVLYAMVVQYYYGYGDSLIYYEGGTFLRKLIGETPDSFNVFFMSATELSDMAGKYDVSSYAVGTMANDANMAVMKISALLSYLSFNHYIIISIFLAFFSFIGTWKLFRTFDEILAFRSAKLLAYAILYLPSLWFWGTGLIKESICMGAMGICVSCLYKIFIKKQISIKDLLVLAINFYLLFVIKSYIAGILLAAVAAAFVSFFITSRAGFFSKMVTTLTTVLLGVAIFSLSLSKYLDTLMEESAAVIEVSKMAYALEDDERSAGGFAAEDYDISIQGLILKTPSAIFTTFFRPFLWETRKIVMLFSALESLLMFGATIFLLFRCRFFRFFSIIFSNPFLVFCLVFCMLMGTVVGLTTFNFGTLVRYRLPLLPFYGFMLIAIYVWGDARSKTITPAADNI